MKQYYYSDNRVTIYNACASDASTLPRYRFAFADPPFDLNLDPFEDSLRSVSDNLFLMSSERNLVSFCAKNIEAFTRLYAVDTVIPKLISNSAPMQLADFVAHLRFSKKSKVGFINNNQAFSNLIRCTKVRQRRQYSGNFDKGETLPAYFIKHFTVEGDTCVDLFAGSFSTTFAAVKLSRKSIAFEIDEAMCERAARILSQKNLFDFK